MQPPFYSFQISHPINPPPSPIFSPRSHCRQARNSHRSPVLPAACLTIIRSPSNFPPPSTSFLLFFACFISKVSRVRFHMLAPEQAMAVIGITCFAKLGRGWRCALEYCSVCDSCLPLHMNMDAIAADRYTWHAMRQVSSRVMQELANNVTKGDPTDCYF